MTPCVCACALQENVWRTCGPVQGYVVFYGQEAIKVLKNMEGKFLLTPITFSGAEGSSDAGGGHVLAEGDGTRKRDKEEYWQSHGAGHP